MTPTRIFDGIADALGGALDVQQALTRTLALVTEQLGLETGWVWLLDAESNQFYLAAARNLPPYLRQPVRMTGQACWCIETFRQGRLTAKNIDIMACSRLHAAVQSGEDEATAGLRCHASIPLVFGDLPLGIMNVTAPSGRELTADELRLLATVAHQAGVAVERARLAEEGARLARADERARMAREIHDTLAQNLTAIALHIEGALPHLNSDPDRARRRLESALGAARAGLEDARRSVLDLRTALPDGRPLPDALRALARTFTSETGIPVSVRARMAVSLPPRLESELFRIVKEALANIRRHADASRANIFLRASEAAIRLTVRDDGRGFEPHAAREGGQGIVGMKERAKLLGGRLHIESHPGRGAAVRVSVPLEQETGR